MAKIKILDKNVANQIAAGEVVERPASVIKELVENSLDAGATVIDVEIIQGGIEYLRVTDNGQGMSAEDALLAIERHATSKINLAEDLAKIHTLGFRGEALPSIASVSEFKLLTRTKEDELAIIVQVAGGSVKELEKTGANLGTTVFVENLFYNLPARRKFLKTVSTEARYINEVITKLALSRPDVKFTLKNNERLVLKTPGSGQLQDCIQALYGSEVAEALLTVNLQAAGIVVTGFVSRPSFTKSSRILQLAFVNKRSITSKLVYRAIDAAYQSKIARGTHPFALLNITIDTEQVDVNVHPQKQEVKFSDDSFVYRHLYRAILNALEYPLEELVLQEKQGTQNIEAISNATEVSKDNSPRLVSFCQEKNYIYPKQQETAEIWRAAHSEIEATIRNNVATKQQERSQIITEAERSSVATTTVVPNIALESMKTINEKSSLNEELSELKTRFDPITGEVASVVVPLQDASSLFEDKKFSKLQALGQVLNKYILAEQGDKLVIIDQHAAHERIIYDKLVQQEQANYVQELLVPEYIKLLRSEEQLIQENLAHFLQIGLQLEFVGQQTVRVASVPAAINSENFREFFNYLLQTLLEYKKPTLADFRQAVAHSVACKAAIKAGKNLDLGQMQLLLEELLATTHPFTCPHGRPIMIEFTDHELNKMFKRS